MFAALEDLVLLYPVYALLFADAGLSLEQISSLFAIWSVTAFALEVPLGVLADRVSRRRVLATGAVLRATAFTLWVTVPSYPAFALGFVLWGVESACTSGTLEALVYAGLAEQAATARYPTLLGRAGAAALAAELAATALAAPVLALGGYPLVGWASVAVCLATVPAALSFPERARGNGNDDPGGVAGYLHTLRAGLGEVRRGPAVAGAVLIAALLPGVVAIDEYLPLLARDTGVATHVVPWLVLLTTTAMGIGSALAGRWAAAGATRVRGWLTLAAALLAVGALTRSPLGFVAVAAAFGLAQVAMVVTAARLQDVVTEEVRATVTSVAGLGAELTAVAVFAGFAAGSGTSVSVLVAASAVPLLVLAGAVVRLLPPPPHLT